MPDFRMEVAELIAEGDRAVVRWTATATFAGPGTIDGVQPTGSRVEFEGVDVLRVEGDEIVHNDAFVDETTVSRQLGLLPAEGSSTQLRITAAFNTRTRIARRIADRPEEIAEGVWIVRAGFNQDTDQARASVRKLAALEPAAAWPGHADPLTGDVRGQLVQAADTT
jgi:hypothetical protein